MSDPDLKGPKPLRTVHSRGKRLNSWKEIAAYLERDVRTVQRWEHRKGLPVYRLGEGKRVPIYALAGELDDWCRGSGEIVNTESTTRPSPYKWLWGVAALCLAGVAAFAVWWFVPRRVTESQFKVVPLTTEPGTQLCPTLSPDGSQVAFVWNGEHPDEYHLYVKMVSGGSARRITSVPVPASAAPQWSPDGNWIAFLRDGTVYLISPLDPAERQVAQAAAASWAPDGKSLVISERQAGGQFRSLYLFSLATFEKRRLTTPPPDTYGDSLSAFSPDGRSVAFVRGLPGLGGDIYVMAVAGGGSSGAEWRLTKDSGLLAGFAWTSDGKEIVFSSDRGGRRSLWRVRASRGARPERIAGTDDAGRPAISKGTHARLAYEVSYDDRNLWCMDLPANGGPPGKAVRIIDSSVPDFAPQFSPDGTRLAFVSARSGNMEIWTSDTRGSNLFQVTALRSYASVPRWSPDGTRLAFNASIEGNSDIFTVNADGGGLKRVTFEPSWEARPSWSHDGRWLYFRSNRSGSDQIWKAPPEGGEAVQITRSGGMEAFEAPDGGTLFYAKSWAADGIWTVPVQGGPETLAIGGIMPNFWGVANRGVFYLDFGASSEGSVPLMLLSFETRESLPIAVIEKVQPSNDPGFTVTGDGRRIAWAQNDRVEAKLMLVEGFR